MSELPELPKTYEPAAIEEKWYADWLAHEFFKADPESPKPAYSIVIPPPNVTGVLTLGHVLNNTIQDILARRARMLGKEVLWLPGTDHAGIATQNVVEKTLRKEGLMKHRDDLGREVLVGKIWEWKEKYGGIIINQLKRLGASCDWSRERFTMDAEYSQCVAEVFVDLYKKGLIYRGKRMVNWCPATQTAVSDEEVEMRPQNGQMYHFRVEIVEEPGRFLEVASTRPETIPGDTAIAVNPHDPRYSALIGKHARRPLPRENQAALPIVGDEAIDIAFGTGVLKVTPAHDRTDYEIGARHALPIIDVIRPDGKMNALAGADLAGLDRFEARKKAAELLGEMIYSDGQPALVKAEPYANNVGYSDRGGVPIEPRLSEQWFLKYPSVEASRAVVADGRMKFYPERWAKVYDHWLGGLQDWCISRQLWWGHRIPVWKTSYDHYSLGTVYTEISDLLSLSTGTLEFVGSDSSKVGVMIDGKSATSDAKELLRIGIELAEKELEIRDIEVQFCTIDPKVISACERQGWTQDPDVLDTWFSSWLWPFATMGWPEKTPALAKFYPTTDLVTGPDIIFFWVARMIMAGYEWMGEMPFRNVYFTGIIRDKQGRKMSKSLGNSPDPLDLIAKFGADALRFGVMRSAPLGADILFDEKNVELGRNFCTKLWNAARFRQMQGGESEGEINPALLTSDDHWILLRLDGAIREVSAALEEYRFSDAANGLYRFFWSEYCDWYVEASKANLARKKEDLRSSGSAASAEERGEAPPLANSSFLNVPLALNTLAVMDFVLGHTLRLFHPFMPFITEELWHGMGFNGDLPVKQGGETIMFAHWPEPLDEDFKAHYGLTAEHEALAVAKYEVVNLGRGLRRDFNIASNKRARFVLQPSVELAAHEVETLRILLNAEPFEVISGYEAPKGTPTVITPLGALYLPLVGLIDVEAERARLAKEIEKTSGELAKVRAKLDTQSFVEKVPKAVLDEHKQREQAWAEKLTQLEKMREALG